MRLPIYRTMGSWPRVTNGFAFCAVFAGLTARALRVRLSYVLFLNTIAFVLNLLPLRSFDGGKLLRALTSHA
jgi:Zn-dependent protease